jgi:hypothetical protein
MIKRPWILVNNFKVREKTGQIRLLSFIYRHSAAGLPIHNTFADRPQFFGDFHVGEFSNWQLSASLNDYLLVFEIIDVDGSDPFQ